MQFLKIAKFVVHRSKKPYDVYIGRPSKWGNPFSTKSKDQNFLVTSRAEAVQKYEEFIRSKPDMIKQIKTELRGKVLGCWCAPALCHGHILAWIANEE